MKKIAWCIISGIAIICSGKQLQAQILTSEDSLASGLVAGQAKTLLSGYGEANVNVDFTRKNAEATLKRLVLFVGHKFSNHISLFSEIELENALVASGSNRQTGEIAVEQALIKFDLNRNHYLLAGLIIPRMGLLNENHLPTTFYSVERPWVEQLIIPTTWRSIGIGYYGTNKNLPGLHYHLAITKGLSAANFTSGTGIAEGRQLGNRNTGYSTGMHASLLYYLNHFRLQYAGYMGGTTALEGRIADSLQLDAHPFAHPVFINECNVVYRKDKWETKILGAYISIPDAFTINQVYANNTPQAMFGAYAECAYHVTVNSTKKSTLIPFVRAELLDMNAKTPVNGITTGEYKQFYLLAGMAYKPIQGVAVKLDYTYRNTGNRNDALIVTPFPQLTPFFKQRNMLNLGVSYIF